MVGISSDNRPDHKITRPGLTMCYRLLLRHGEGTDGSSHHIHIPGVLACQGTLSLLTFTLKIRDIRRDKRSFHP